MLLVECGMSLQSLASKNCHIRLAAIDQSRNVAREYEIYACSDLFGTVLVDYYWGRRGRKGQGNRKAFPDHASAERFIRMLLRRRDSAEKRIGVAYLVIG